VSFSIVLSFPRALYPANQVAVLVELSGEIDMCASSFGDVSSLPAPRVLSNPLKSLVYRAS
jgi:hypothetical protein